MVVAEWRGGTRLLASSSRYLSSPFPIASSPREKRRLEEEAKRLASLARVSCSPSPRARSRIRSGVLVGVGGGAPGKAGSRSFPFGCGGRWCGGASAIWGRLGELGPILVGARGWIPRVVGGVWMGGGCSCCAIRGIRGMLRAFVELCENFGF